LPSAPVLTPEAIAMKLQEAVVFQQEMALANAQQIYEEILCVNPHHFDALQLLGVVFGQLKAYDKAIDFLSKALVLNPQSALVLNNRGQAYYDIGQYANALIDFEKALSIKPDYFELYSKCGDIYFELRQFEKSLSCYEKLLHINPDTDFLLGRVVYLKMLLCYWDRYDQTCAQIMSGIEQGNKVARPFGLQAITFSEQALKRGAEIFCKEHYPAQHSVLKIKRHLPSSKIRIAYLSGEFRDQATSILITELIELHDKDSFEIIAFDNGWDDQSIIRGRLAKAFDQMIDISGLNDLEAAQLIASLEIDILVNLNGFFGKPRTNIFAHRAAPIQVNYLGFPGTMGADYMDYLIADPTVIPKDSQQHYSEKIAYLPHAYQPNDSKRKISDVSFTRAQLGLPESGFVFCCFNNNYKITPSTFDAWMRILKAVEGSVLWLLSDNQTAEANLRSQMRARGVDDSRLIFAKRLTLAEHLARHRAADLFLDTLPYNAHTTASDALWAGLPVLTQMGTTFPGRVAASLLKAVKLPELITHTTEQYEALAIDLATHPEKLAQIREKLAANRLTTPLFDTPTFAKHIETAYEQMMERYWAGLAPDHIEVRSLLGE